MKLLGELCLRAKSGRKTSFCHFHMSSWESTEFLWRRKFTCDERQGWLKIILEAVWIGERIVKIREDVAASDCVRWLPGLLSVHLAASLPPSKEYEERGERVRSQPSMWTTLGLFGRASWEIYVCSRNTARWMRCTCSDISTLFQTRGKRFPIHAGTLFGEGVRLFTGSLLSEPRRPLLSGEPSSAPGPAAHLPARSERSRRAAGRKVRRGRPGAHPVAAAAERGRRAVGRPGGGLCLRPAPLPPPPLPLPLPARSRSRSPSRCGFCKVGCSACVCTQHREQENGLIREAGGRERSRCSAGETEAMRRQTEDGGTR